MSNVIFHQISAIQNCIQLNFMDSGNQILSNVVKSKKAKFEKYWGNNEKTNLFVVCLYCVGPTESVSMKTTEAILDLRHLISSFL